MTTNTIQHTKPSEAVAFRFPFSNFITVKRDHFAMLWPCIENENVNFVTFHNFAFNRQKNTKSRPSHSKGSQLNIYLSTSKFISRCNLVWMLLFHHHCRHRHQHHSKSNSSQLFRKKTNDLHISIECAQCIRVHSGLKRAWVVSQATSCTPMIGASTVAETFCVLCCAVVRRRVRMIACIEHKHRHRYIILFHMVCTVCAASAPSALE